MLRYIVERISDGVFLELELPIIVSSAGRRLGGPGSFSGEIVPVVDAYRYAGTDALIDPYATYIHEEADGQIRGTWLVTRSAFEGAVWQIEGQGFSAFFAGRPFEGEYRGIDEDPIAVAATVCAHAQQFAGANIGVQVVGGSGVRVGTDSDIQVQLAQEALDNLKAGQEAEKKALEAARKTAKANPTSGNKTAVAELTEHVAEMEGERETLEAALAAAKERQQADGGAWKILWWDTPDCLQAMQEAIDAAGYEWVEWSGWNADRTRVLKEIRCVERVGKRQETLSFIEGDNIIETVVIESDAADYANTVVAIGAGEGRKALRSTVAKADGRRRKVHVLDAKHVTKQGSLDKLAAAELKRRTQKLKVAGIRVVNHPNAQDGTYSVGDTILIDTEVGWLGRQRIWQRIEEIEWDGDGVTDLILGDPV